MRAVRTSLMRRFVGSRTFSRLTVFFGSTPTRRAMSGRATACWSSLRRCSGRASLRSPLPPELSDRVSWAGDGGAHSLGEEDSDEPAELASVDVCGGSCGPVRGLLSWGGGSIH